jgi:iron complex outermembrane recepter protein
MNAASNAAPLPCSLPGRTRLCLALALALTTATAAAQEDPRHVEATDLDAVIVRATLLPRTAEDLTRPVEVLAGARLDESKSNSLGETVNRLPGVQSSYFGPGVGRPIIRGLDGARVQVLSDGLGSGDVSTLSADHAVSIEPFLANQIEVLKGPATLLYGSGAIGGAVNVVEGRIPESATTQPLQGRAEFRSGSVNDEKTGMFRLDGTSASGHLVFHADGLHRETGDYDIPGFAESARLRAEEATAGDDAEEIRGTLPNSALRTDSGALGVSWVGDRGFAGAGASLFNTRYGIPGAAHHDHGSESGDDDEAAVRIVLDQRRHEFRAGLDDLGAFETLRVKLASNDYTHTEFEGEEVGTVFDNRAWEGRAELVHRAWAGWNGAFGLQASRREFSAIGEEAFVPDATSRDTGLFWIGERDFGPLALELGARHDRVEINIDPDNAIGPSREFDATSLSVAARWNFSDDFHLSLGLDRAQRAPASEELYSDGLHVATNSFEFGNPDLDVETANRGELGIHWHRGSLKLGASLYQVRYDDFIYLADTGVEEHGSPARVWNQADARFTGGEIDLQWTFLENASGAWTARLFGDSVRGRLTGSGTRIVTFQIEDEGKVESHTSDIALSGNLPRIAPARVGAELRWAGQDWRAGLGAVRYARQDRLASFEDGTDGYTLVHANVSWHRDMAGGRAMEVFLNGSNLLDEEARPHTSFLKDLSPLPGRGISTGLRIFF